MTHDALDAVQRRANGAGHPNQLARDLDELMEHLDAVQPEHGAPQRHRDIEMSSVQMRAPRLWDRLKDAARQLVHPQVEAKHATTNAPSQMEAHTAGAATLEDAHPVALTAGRAPPPLPAVVDGTKEEHPSFSHPPSCAFSINGYVIQQRGGLYKLDDLRKYGRVVPRKAPRKFIGSVRAKAVLASLTARHPNTPAYKVRQSVWGMADLLLAYADWCGLSADLKSHHGVVGTEPEAVQPGELVVNGIRIRYQPDHQWYNLGDLRKASGYEYDRAPRVFLKTNGARALMVELSKERDASTLLSAGRPGVGGKLGVVWACREVMLAYAKWLSPMTADAVLAALDAEDVRLARQSAAPSPRVEPVETTHTVDASAALLNIVLESGWPVIHRERNDKSYVLVDVNSFGGREIERLWRAMKISQPNCNVPRPRQVALSDQDITAWAFEVSPAIGNPGASPNGGVPDDAEKTTGLPLVPVQAPPPHAVPSAQVNVDLGVSPGDVTMTSGEIAELVNSRHEDVRRSIDRLVKKGVIQEPPTAFSEKINNLGLPQKNRHYVFSGEQGKRDSMIAVGQLAPGCLPKITAWWEQRTHLSAQHPEMTGHRALSPLDCVQINVNALSSGLTMSSLDIAALTGKRHDHVMRDIRVMLAELEGEGGVPKFGDTHINPQNNQSYPIFRLPKDLTLTLVSGYSVVLRKRIIDRWLELERHAAMGAFGVPQTLQAALRMAADLLDENQALRLENQSLKQLTGPTKDETTGQAGSGVSATASALSTKELAHTLGIKLTDLCQFLREEGLLKRGRNYFHVPTPRALSDGLFAIRPLPRRHNGPYMQTVATEKGQAHIQQRLTARGLLNKRA